MNRIGLFQKLKIRWRAHPSLSQLIAFLFAIGFFGFWAGITIFLTTGLQEGLFNLGICFTNSCVQNAIQNYSMALLLFKETLNLLIGVATVGGIIVALMSYLNSAGATALSNHISHFSIFQNYLNNEIAKRDRISPTSIDTLLWYNTIFSNSRSGRTEISPNYINVVDQLNREIEFSNDQAAKASTDSFRYKPHQERVIKALSSFGIKLTHQPRNDFFEIETQIFSLISCTNSSFCYSNEVPPLRERIYR